MFKIEVGSKLLITDVDKIAGGFNYFENGLIVEVLRIHPLTDYEDIEFEIITTTNTYDTIFSIYSNELDGVALYMGSEIH